MKFKYRNWKNQKLTEDKPENGTRKCSPEIRKSGKMKMTPGSGQLFQIDSTGSPRERRNWQQRRKKMKLCGKYMSFIQNSIPNSKVAKNSTSTLEPEEWKKANFRCFWRILTFWYLRVSSLCSSIVSLQIQHHWLLSNSRALYPRLV